MSRSLEDRIPDVDWYGLLLKASDLALTRWREGNPLIKLLDTPPREGSKWFLRPYVETGLPTVFFTYGGSGKSLLAAGMAVSIITGRDIVGAEPLDCGPVIYLDWEADEYSHSERVRAICAGAGIDPEDVKPHLHYRREYASLASSAAPLRKRVVETGAKAIIIDSVSAARGSETKDEAATVEMFSCLRSMNITPILLDHLPKDPKADKTSPIGTVLTTNRARNLWRVDKAQYEDGGDDLDLCLVHTKTNNGRYQPKRGLAISFENGDDDQLLVVRFRPQHLLDMPSFRSRAPMWQQIAGILRANRGTPLSVSEILNCLEVEAADEPDGLLAKKASPPSDAKVRATLNFYRKVFVAVSGNRGEQKQWGLLETTVRA